MGRQAVGRCPFMQKSLGGVSGTRPNFAIAQRQKRQPCGCLRLHPLGMNPLFVIMTDYNVYTLQLLHIGTG